MKHNKIILGVLSLLLSFKGWAQAPVVSGPDKEKVVTPVYENYGNVSRAISIPISTSTAVLISSSPENAVMVTSPTTNLGLQNWRFREIINVSTCCRLALYTTPYNVFSATFGVVIGSDTSGNGMGEVYAVPHQQEVYGIWDGSGTVLGTGGAGAGGDENYYDPRKRR